MKAVDALRILCLPDNLHPFHIATLCREEDQVQVDFAVLRMPRLITAGRDAMTMLAQEAAGAKSIAVFADGGVRAAGLLDAPLKTLRQEGAQVHILDNLPTEPTVDEAQHIIDAFKGFDADLIVAIGGGSVMDIAKLASVFKGNTYTLRDLLTDPLRASKQVRTVMVPTTAGTGAEATPNAIVLVPEQQLKVGIVNPEMIVDAVILDAGMIARLPQPIAAATGIDAMAHAVECLLSNKATPFSDLFAMEAWALIESSIEGASVPGGDRTAKEKMMLASFYAGVAITASGTTAVHALSYPLGGKYRIPHGLSNAIMLMPVMRFNRPACTQVMARMYDRCWPQGAAQDEEAKADAVLERLTAILKNLNIRLNLKDHGVKPEDLEQLVEAGMSVTRLLNNNPCPVTADDARRMYQEVM